jgi:hypothetical protein
MASGRDEATLAGFTDALKSLDWVASHRRPVPSTLETQLRLLCQPSGSHDFKTPDRRLGKPRHDTADSRVDT